MRHVDFERWLEAALFEALGFMPGKGITAHTSKMCLFLKADWRAVTLRLHKQRPRGSRQHPGGVKMGFRMKMGCHRKAVLCFLPSACRDKARVWGGWTLARLWPWRSRTATSNEICEWKEVKMNLVRILKTTRGSKGIGGKIYINSRGKKCSRKKKCLILVHFSAFFGVYASLLN